MTDRGVFLLLIIFLCANLSLVAYIIIRRLIRAPGERDREKRRQAYAIMVNNYVIHDINPTAADASAFISANKLDQDALEYIISERLRLLKGQSRSQLAKIYELSGLTIIRINELINGGIWQRRRAAGALGDAFSERAILALTVALRDPDEDVRLISAKSLAKMKAVSSLEYIVSLFRDLPEDRCTNVADAVISFGMAAGEPLINMLGDDSEKARYWASVCLSNTHIVSGHGECIVAAKNIAGILPRESSPRVRASLCQALGHVNVMMCDSTDVLIAMLDDPDAVVRRTAATALGALANPAAAESLFALLDDTDWDVSLAASRALAALGPQITALEEKHMADATGMTRARLTEVLDMARRGIVME